MQNGGHSAVSELLNKYPWLFDCDNVDLTGL